MSWLSSNWRWLLVLPVALVILVAASSYRLKTFWYDSGLNNRIAEAEPGEWVTVTDDFTDAVGPTSRTFEVRVTGLERTLQVPDASVIDEPEPMPEGLVGVRPLLDLRADPDPTLQTCQLALLDADGRRYEITSDSGQPSPCVPEDAQGPEYALLDGSVRGELPLDQPPRPAVWSVRPTFLVPQDVEITQVLLWWDFPDYVELPVPR